MKLILRKIKKMLRAHPRSNQLSLFSLTPKTSQTCDPLNMELER